MKCSNHGLFWGPVFASVAMVLVMTIINIGPISLWRSFPLAEAADSENVNFSRSPAQITILQDGTLIFEDQKMNSNSLARELRKFRQTAEGEGATSSLRIRAHRDSDTGAIRRVLAVSEGVGIDVIYFAVRRPMSL